MCNGVFNVKNYGAVGDGKTLNTIAVQRAIDECANLGGGRVEISNGTYLCGSIELKSYVELHVADNAVLLASPNLNDFAERKAVKHVNTEMLPRESNACFIFADECEHISISGGGVIDCNGHNFVRLRSDDGAGWKYERVDWRSVPRVVFFAGCKFVKIEGVTMQNQPAGWSYWIHDCDYINISKIKIIANVDYPNNDGVHINCSRNVTVSDCDITCGDDCIVVRANSASLSENKICEKVSVTNCNLTSYSAGIRIGWINDGTIKNCVFSNLVMTDCTVGISLLVPRHGKRPELTDVGRESLTVENLSFNNVVMNEVCFEPIMILLHDNEAAQIKSVKNLYFSNIHAKGPHFFILRGREDCYLENIRFSDCEFEITDGKEFPDAKHHGALSFDNSGYVPITVRYVKNFKMNNVELNVNR